MPIYVYEPTIYSENEQVNDCCYFEVLQGIGEKPFTQCPTCKHSVHKAVCAFNVPTGGMDKLNSENSGKSESSVSSPAKNAARLASRHLCGAGCSH